MQKRKNRRQRVHHELPDPETLPVVRAERPLAEVMQDQHPIHGLFADVFYDIGGKERLADWAEDHYDRFIQIFAKMSPPPQPAQSNNQINIQVNANLGPSALDE